MHPDLQTQWNALEDQRKAFVDRVTSLSPELQSTRATSKDFSPVEVLMHFALVEDFDLQLMRKAPPTTLAGKKAKPNFIYRFVIYGQSNGKRVPTASNMTPQVNVNLTEATEKWAKARQEIAELLDPLPGPDAPAIRHPLFGLLSAADLIHLLSAHTRYHEIRFAVAKK
jgi:hypothetical protein